MNIWINVDEKPLGKIIISNISSNTNHCLSLKYNKMFFYRSNES